MSEKSQKTQKKNWFKGLNAEFKSFRIRSAGSNHRIS